MSLASRINSFFSPNPPTTAPTDVHTQPGFEDDTSLGGLGLNELTASNRKGKKALAVSGVDR